MSEQSTQRWWRSWPRSYRPTGGRKILWLLIDYSLDYRLFSQSDKSEQSTQRWWFSWPRSYKPTGERKILWLLIDYSLDYWLFPHSDMSEQSTQRCWRSWPRSYSLQTYRRKKYIVTIDWLLTIFQEWQVWSVQPAMVAHLTKVIQTYRRKKHFVTIDWLQCMLLTINYFPRVTSLSSPLSEGGSLDQDHADLQEKEKYCDYWLTILLTINYFPRVTSLNSPPSNGGSLGQDHTDLQDNENIVTIDWLFSWL